MTKLINLLSRMTLATLVTVLAGAPNIWASSSITSQEKTTTAERVLEKDFVILDVRTPEEFRESAIKGALNIDVTDPNFAVRIQALDKKKSYKLYCRTGNRSGRAEKAMKERGFTMVENLGSIGQAANVLGKACTPKACP
jgi:phage shock protein E